MDTKGIKIALTIAVGILIGWLIGHTISNVFTYRIAVTIIGAIAGYFIWEPMKVWQAGRNIILGTTWVVWEIICILNSIILYNTKYRCNNIRYYVYINTKTILNRNRVNDYVCFYT
jgi:uncharacterized protein YcfJ